MDNKVNVAELLKNCPTGMELNCTVYDDVKFDKIDEESDYPIRITIGKGGHASLTKFGQWTNSNIAKCVIFPKGQTTWDGFAQPCKFKDGDIIADSHFKTICIFKGEGSIKGTVDFYCGIDNSGKYFFIKDIEDQDEHFGDIKGYNFATEEEKRKLFDAIKRNGYRWDTKTKTLENWTIQDAKDGDVIFYDEGWTCIFKRIHGIWYSSYCFITSDGEFHTGYEEHAVDSTINGKAHLATKEQSNLLFQKMKESGYKWNPETKTLEKLPKFKVGDRVKSNGSDRHYIIKDIKLDRYVLSNNKFLKFTDEHDFELVTDNFDFNTVRPFDKEWDRIKSVMSSNNKFDINTLKPFDKVLMRSSNAREWVATFYSHYNNKKFYGCGMCCNQCIPYEGNEHLINTTNDCDKFFIVWEESY